MKVAADSCSAPDKSGKVRGIPMEWDGVAEALVELQSASKGGKYVFPGPDGEPMGSIKTAFMKARAEAGIPSKCRFHDLRHTFASHLVMNGVDLTTVKELLGHKTLVMTLRYSHLSQGHKKRAVEVVETIFGGHFLDTRTEKVAVGQDVPVTQLVEFTGAGDGGRTRTGASPEGF